MVECGRARRKIGRLTVAMLVVGGLAVGRAAGVGEVAEWNTVAVRRPDRGRRRARPPRLPAGGLDLAQASLEEAALGVVGDEGERLLVGLPRFLGAPEPPPQVGTRGV